ncbi:hypothetical protein AMTRI_Chr02g219200 [Amborella trichopoda]
MEKYIEVLVKEMKQMMREMKVHIHNPSAYDIAWAAMIPSDKCGVEPMFPKCLEWIIENQKDGGFWGGEDDCNSPSPTAECLPATFACIVALKTWDVGHECMGRGLDFIHGNIEKLLLEHSPQFATQWFTIILLGTIELAQSKGLEIFPKGFPALVKSLFRERERILERENLTQNYEVALLYHLEAMPATYQIDFGDVLRFKGPDGSLFGSPSSTACAFIATKDSDFLNYLKSMFQKVENGAPATCPVDEGFIKLWMVDLLENLGLEEYFSEEIQKVLNDTYMVWMEDDEENNANLLVVEEMYKDSLAFRLLRTHGYRVSPSKFCWHLSSPQIRSHVEENYEEYLSPMLSIYKASHFMFLGENELENAMSFSKSLLEKALSNNNTYDRFLFLKDLRDEIEFELSAPWLARLDHLVHFWHIQQFENNEMPWMGKAWSFGLAARTHNMLAELAKRNYTLRQSNFKDELGKLERWAKKSGIRDLGFGREKTVYCYFASATTCYHPHLSLARLASAQTAILVTVIDDFFDFHGSMDELQSFTDAIKRWDGRNLIRDGKVLFSAVHDHVNTIAKEAFHQQGRDITIDLRQMWNGAVNAWLKEAEWSRNNYLPSIEEYIEVGMTSIAADLVSDHAIYLSPLELSNEIPHHARYEKVSELTMLCARLLNDLQSYEKESEEGKSNLVVLIMKANPNATTQDAIACIEKILDQKKKELVEKILIDYNDSLPRQCKMIHLGTLKAFQMFFNGTNAFDSPTQLLHEINKAFYEDLTMKASELTPLKDEQSRLDVHVNASMAKENRLASRSQACLRKCNKPSQGSWATPIRGFGFRPRVHLSVLKSPWFNNHITRMRV